MRYLCVAPPFYFLVSSGCLINRHVTAKSDVTIDSTDRISRLRNGRKTAAVEDRVAFRSMPDVQSPFHDRASTGGGPKQSE
jgi:hypothetical protein